MDADTIMELGYRPNMDVN